MPRERATSSGPVSQCSAPRLMSFQGAAVAREVSWQDRNSSRSAGVAMPEALQKSSYWRIRWAGASAASPLGARQAVAVSGLSGAVGGEVPDLGPDWALR